MQGSCRAIQSARTPEFIPGVNSKLMTPHVHRESPTKMSRRVVIAHTKLKEVDAYFPSGIVTNNENPFSHMQEPNSRGR